MIPDDDIERLRQENEELRKNLNNLLDSGKNPKGVSFKQNEQFSNTTNNYYEKDGPSILSNPFLKNQYNSAYLESQFDDKSRIHQE